MRIILLITLLGLVAVSYGQIDNKISTIDFVQIIDDNKDEAVYFYQNNWEVLRDMAVKKGYIHTYQFLEVSPSEDAPFDLMLITTYLNEDQYKLREEHFAVLIKDNGPLKLLNSKKPEAFRKSLFAKESARHLE